MQKKHLSFQEAILGGIGNLLIDAGMTNCPAERDGLALVIDSLAAYQEEGQRLYPKIILSENMPSVKLLLPQSEEIHIGSGPISEETYLKCLKKCAPLAAGEWYIFIERRATEIRYGLIRTGDGILSLSPEALLPDLALDANNTPMIILRQITERTVEATTSNNHSLSISFSGRTITGVNRRIQLTRLFEAISELTSDEVRAKLPVFLERIFNWVMERGHGALAIVVPRDTFKMTVGLQDGNWLQEPIDLAEKVRSLVQLADSEAVVSTRAIIDVIAGMLMSDGITVFDNAGRVLGFNIFAKAVTSEHDNTTVATGGARRRAFALLSSWVGVELIACFMISQDGDTAYHQDKD